MIIFKFGGASVKDAQAVQNVANILQEYNSQHIVVVISAMDKTTNNLEWLVNSYCYAKAEVKEALNNIVDYHNKILWDLFPDKKHQVYNTVNELFFQIEDLLDKEMNFPYDKIYDQFIGYGELLSTVIVSAYLHDQGIQNNWLDARNLIRTDDRFRQAAIEWSITEVLIKDSCRERRVYITQGFIGSTIRGETTSLGREGSDFTAAILAFCLDAQSVTIWKDVPGMLNADPKFYPNATKLEKISYREAIELSYYGASVIHPKTVKPLQNKGIPLYIKSFLNTKEKGSVIQESDEFDAFVPSFIFTRNQLLMSLSPRDFSFVAEGHLYQIFSVLSKLGIKVNIMQNSAISFSICFENDPNKTKELISTLEKEYKIFYNKEITLFTIRHYNESTIREVVGDRKILLEQRTRTTARFALME